MREGGLCAELLRFSHEIKLKDWIDGGSFNLYYLRLRDVAQSGVLFFRHPIVVDHEEKTAPIVHPGEH